VWDGSDSFCTDPLLKGVPREFSQMRLERFLNGAIVLAPSPFRKQRRYPRVTRPNGGRESARICLSKRRAARFGAEPTRHVLVMRSQIVVRLRIGRLRSCGVPD